MNAEALSPESVRAAREAAGLSQARLARLAGINRSYLCQYENGVRILRDWERERLSEALGSGSAGAASLAPRDGSSVEEVPAKPEEEARAPRAAAALTTDCRVMDGYAVPLGCAAEDAESFLDEMHRVLDRLSTIWGQHPPGFFEELAGAPDADELREEAKLLALRFVVLLGALQGDDRLELPVDKRAIGHALFRAQRDLAVLDPAPRREVLAAKSDDEEAPEGRVVPLHRGASE
ncbi:MAG: helix-turn-helix transcriptional regulator [Pseudomonadales bacterium]|jgi:transcriptional regulator with XRE-family HTH domain|nr:helix-turn-helix transcriptional regulator [Pseudomonadales bacterium]